MKTCLAVCLALLAVLPASAQVLHPHAVRVGERHRVSHHSGHGWNRHHSGWRGSYGFGTGLLFGSLAAGAYDGGYGWVDAPGVYVYRRPFAYGYGPTYYSYAGDVDRGYSRPNYATSGLWLGALAGAVLGNNSGDLGHNAWRGAALGGAAGLLLGSVAERQAQQREAAVVSAPPSPIVTQPAVGPTVRPSNQPPAPAPSAMTAANNLFGRE